MQSIEESEDEIEINNGIEEGIRNKKVCAVTDVSEMHNQIGGHYKIVNFENNTVASKELFNKQWGVRSPKAVEDVIMLNMLDFLTNQECLNEKEN